MQPFHRLERTDRSGLYVKAPIFSHPTKPDHFEVRAYHLELLSQVGQFTGFYLPQADAVLFESFDLFYQAIANLLQPRFEARQIEPRSRHSFFIATDPVPNPLNPDELVPGLSGLETLMGYELPTPPTKETPIHLTSGDPDADLVAAMLVTFKTSALSLMSRYCRSDLINILSQSQNLLRGDEAIKALQQERDRELFEQNKDQIDAALSQMGGIFLD